MLPHAVTTPGTSDTPSTTDSDSPIDAWGDQDLADKYKAKAEKKLRGLIPSETSETQVQSIYDSVMEESPATLAAGSYKRERKVEKQKRKQKEKIKGTKIKVKNTKKDVKLIQIPYLLQ